MVAITGYLEKKLKLQVNRDKSAVARPWKRKFLGYSVTWHKQARLKIADSSLKRLKDRVREIVVGNASRNLAATIEALNPVLRGWTSYFRLTERCAGGLGQLDTTQTAPPALAAMEAPGHPQQAATSSRTGRDARVEIGKQRTRSLVERRSKPHAWGISKTYIDQMGLVSVLDTQHRFQHV